MNWLDYMIIGVVLGALAGLKVNIQIGCGKKTEQITDCLNKPQKQFYNELVAVAHRYYRNEIAQEEITPLLRTVNRRYMQEGAMSHAERKQVINCLSKITAKHDPNIVRLVEIE